MQLGGLIVSHSWGTGNIMDRDIWPETNGVVVRFFGEPNRPHILETSTSLTNWTPLLTNTATTTVSDFHLANAPDAASAP